METIKLDLIPGKKMPSLHASQFDDGRTHGIDLFENGVVYKLDGTETLTINERKGDNCICSLDIENTFADSNHIVFASTEQMCAVWGNNICELVITKGEKTIGTLNFILEIEPSPTENGIESESEISNLERQIEEITEQVIGDNYYTAEETDDAIATATEGKADKTYVDTELAKKADKSDTYTKAQVDSALSGKANVGASYTKSEEDALLANKAGIADVYNKQTVDNKLAEKANTSDVNTALATKADVTTVSALSGNIAFLNHSKADKETTYTKAQVDSALSGKANVGVSYTKSEEDNLLSGKADKADTYTKSEVDNVLGNKADKSTTYTKQETDTLLSNKADMSDTYTKEQVDDIVYNILPDDTASGSVANFNTSLALPIKSLEVDVNAVQEAGTPTPSTPKAISGWSTITLDANGNTEVINLGGTYYGGHFTQDKAGHRQFVVTSKFATFTGANNESWIDYPAGNGFFINLINDHITESYGDGKCNILPTSKSFSTLGIVFGINSTYIFLMQVKSSWNISTVNELRDFLSVNNLQVVYTLAEPIIIDLPDGEPIITLNGTNNIYADTGDCAVEYKVSVEDYVSAHSGGNLLGMGGVYLGGAKSGGGEEEPTEESEDTEKTKLDDPKEEIKTIGDTKKLGGE